MLNLFLLERKKKEEENVSLNLCFFLSILLLLLFIRSKRHRNLFVCIPCFFSFIELRHFYSILRTTLKEGAKGGGGGGEGGYGYTSLFPELVIVFFFYYYFFYFLLYKSLKKLDTLTVRRNETPYGCPFLKFFDCFPTLSFFSFSFFISRLLWLQKDDCGASNSATLNKYPAAFTL